MRHLIKTTLLFFALCLAPHVHAAIAFDTTGGTQDNSGLVTSLSWSHIMSSGSNGYLEVFCTITQVTGHAVTFGAATYNGTSMTALKTTTVSDGSTDITVRAYGLAAPSTGSNTVQVNISGTLDGNKQFGCQSQSYTGVQQAGQPDSTGSNTLIGSGVTTFTVTDTVAASSWLTGAASEDAGDIAAGAAGSGTTYRGSARFNMIAADSNALLSSGSQTLNWGRAGSTGNLVGVTVALLPAAAATTGITSVSGLVRALWIY